MAVRYLLGRVSFKGPSDDQRFKEANLCDFKRYLRGPGFIPCRFDFDVRVDLSCCLRAWLLSLACFVEFAVEDLRTSRLKA